MSLPMIFRKSKNELEKGGRSMSVDVSREVPMVKCPVCTRSYIPDDIRKEKYVCACGHHMRMSARQRIDFLADKDSFTELYADLFGSDPLQFPGYREKLEQSRNKSEEQEGVICGTADILRQPCAVFVMESQFMMGSMGTVVGEKLTRLFEYAMEHHLPVVGCTVSGGARMQEGILSLMQMAKVSGAVKRYSDAGGFYLTILTDPTTGGVTASFAMEGDIIISEPGATIGFAGARVIEQTVRKKLPAGFQKAEFLMEHGFIDKIVPRSKLKNVTAHLLALHAGGTAI